MTDNLAAPSGTFTLGGDLPVVRLGYGTMQLPGEGVWGPPKDHDEALRVLRRAVEIGITLFDTADSYGPFVAEDLLREALNPTSRSYADDVVIATKAGLTRQGPGKWTPLGQPAYLRQEVEMSLRRLGLERIDLFQLHRIDPSVPRRRSGRRAQGSPGRGKDPPHRPLRGQRRRPRGGPEDGRDRLGAEPVQPREPRRRGAARPLHASRASASSRGSRSRPVRCPKDDGPLADVAKQHDATPSQLALAWLLKRSPVMLPIPGTSSVDHLDSNTAAAAIELSDEEFEALGKAAA